jgi:hypothetical protein
MLFNVPIDVETFGSAVLFDAPIDIMKLRAECVTMF